MPRHIVIHGHFYQPPREDPWRWTVPREPSAAPAHDWNQRITKECYEPNHAARILGPAGQVRRRLNNYGYMSFDFGPTLLAWLEQHAPAVYQGILQGDREAQARFSGHGTAIAHPYHHLILPLASSRDKRTQLLWGVRDFQHRFQRAPEGVWLPETVVDLESLEIAADLGIRFTILAPHQVHRVRALSSGHWHAPAHHEADPTTPYALQLPSGRRFHVFFYHGGLARGVAFDGMLNDGEAMIRRLLGAFSERRAWPQLVHLATDGESYGHHHKFGEMALAYVLDALETRGDARLTTYGEFLTKHGPTHQAEILEHTAWSCAHGMERWRSDCGCCISHQPGWTQQWRAPLRATLDWLRDELDPAFERTAARLLKDPWAARDDYINVLLDGTNNGFTTFCHTHARHPLTSTDRHTVRALLSLQFHRLCMYTSCGWFFDDPSGIETGILLLHAARALELAAETCDLDRRSAFMDRLIAVKSNIPEAGDGKKILTTLLAARAHPRRRHA
ncbi:MAG: DUF3536 domain-containing protein [Deltaproteobacteria bacterium]|nr:DUF3536 domain-containing protein [Deltaproteobacteria bacterium]